MSGVQGISSSSPPPPPLRNSVLCLPTDIHSLLVNKPSSSSPLPPPASPLLSLASQLRLQSVLMSQFVRIQARPSHTFESGVAGEGQREEGQREEGDLRFPVYVACNSWFRLYRLCWVYRLYSSKVAMLICHGFGLRISVPNLCIMFRGFGLMA